MEMVSRVKAVLRRCQPKAPEHILTAGGLSVDLDQRTVTADGQRIQLTYKEFELLRLFLSHPGMAFPREQLFSQVWNMAYMDDSRTLDMHIRTLRQKLGVYGKQIETVRNVGYRWEAISAPYRSSSSGRSCPLPLRRWRRMAMIIWPGSAAPPAA